MLGSDALNTPGAGTTGTSAQGLGHKLSSIGAEEREVKLPGGTHLLALGLEEQGGNSVSRHPGFGVGNEGLGEQPGLHPLLASAAVLGLPPPATTAGPPAGGDAEAGKVASPFLLPLAFSSNSSP